MPAPPPLLLTRPAEASARFAALWRARLGADAPVLIAPAMGIRTVPLSRPLDRRATAIFTSENAVAAVAGQMPRGARAWCVGDRTAEAARAAGFEARSAGGAADDLVAAILAAGEAGPMLHLRGREARGEISARLTARGVPCREIVVYEQVMLPLTMEARTLLGQAGPVLLPLFSPNAAAHLGRQLRDHDGAPLWLAALSPAVAAAWNGAAPERSATAAQPDAEAMLDAMEGLIAAGTPP